VTRASPDVLEDVQAIDQELGCGPIFDRVRVAIERAIALLDERRAALIAAPVAGQIDAGVAA
jgi:hypothetical protein